METAERLSKSDLAQNSHFQEVSNFRGEHRRLLRLLQGRIWRTIQHVMAGWWEQDRGGIAVEQVMKMDWCEWCLNLVYYGAAVDNVASCSPPREIGMWAILWFHKSSRNIPRALTFYREGAQGIRHNLTPACRMVSSTV